MSGVRWFIVGWCIVGWCISLGVGGIIGVAHAEPLQPIGFSVDTVVTECNFYGDALAVSYYGQKLGLNREKIEHIIANYLLLEVCDTTYDTTWVFALRPKMVPDDTLYYRPTDRGRE